MSEDNGKPPVLRPGDRVRVEFEGVVESVYGDGTVVVIHDDGEVTSLATLPSSLLSVVEPALRQGAWYMDARHKFCQYDPAGVLLTKDDDPDSRTWCWRDMDADRWNDAHMVRPLREVRFVDEEQETTT